MSRWVALLPGACWLMEAPSFTWTPAANRGGDQAAPRGWVRAWNWMRLTYTAGDPPLWALKRRPIRPVAGTVTPEATHPVSLPFTMMRISLTPAFSYSTAAISNGKGDATFVNTPLALACEVYAPDNFV